MKQPLAVKQAHAILRQQRKEAAIQQMMVLFDNVLVDKDWLRKHCLDHSQKQIDALTMEVSTGRNTMTLTGKLPRSRLKEILRR